MKDGEVYVAPLGTPVPGGAGVEQDARWRSVGYIRPRQAGKTAEMERVLAQLQRTVDEMTPIFRKTIEDLQRAFAPLAEAMQQHPIPTDPRERALQARRNRNTGPRRPARAPKRLDPRRGR